VVVIVPALCVDPRRRIDHAGAGRGSVSCRHAGEKPLPKKW
jgi:hypothetical protein